MSDDDDGLDFSEEEVVEKVPSRKGQGAGRRRTERERERDYAHIAEWYMMNWSHMAMTDELNKRYYPKPLSRQQIGQDVAKVIDRWRARATTNIEQRKAEELAKVDKLEVTYWDAWERSMEAVKTISRRGDAVMQILRDSDGDPRFLQGVERCLDMRAKILGIYAPVRQKIDLAGMTDDDIITRIKTSLNGLGLPAGGSEEAQAEPGDEEAV